MQVFGGFLKLFCRECVVCTCMEHFEILLTSISETSEFIVIYLSVYKIYDRSVLSVSVTKKTALRT